jgi:hypothetical protein
MIELLLSLPTWVGCGVAMVSTSVLGLVVYFVSYKLIEKYKSFELKDPINGLFRMVSILVSLMLSLAFGEVIAEWQAIKNAINREAVAISDTYVNLEYFDSEGTREIRAVLIDYAQAVIDDDWPAMANDRLGQRASALRRQFTLRVLELKPANSLQKELRSGILADIDTMSDYRLIRLNHSMEKPPVYVLVIIFGFLVSMACFGAYQPQAPLIALASLYTVFIGMVLYLILAMSDPFQGGAIVAPTPFEYLIETLGSGIR